MVPVTIIRYVLTLVGATLSPLFNDVVLNPSDTQKQSQQEIAWLKFLAGSQSSKCVSVQILLEIVARTTQLIQSTGSK